MNSTNVDYLTRSILLEAVVLAAFIYREYASTSEIVY